MQICQWSVSICRFKMCSRKKFDTCKSIFFSSFSWLHKLANICGIHFCPLNYCCETSRKAHEARADQHTGESLPSPLSLSFCEHFFSWFETFTHDEFTETEFTEYDVKEQSYCSNNMNSWLSARLCSCDLNWHIQLTSAILPQLVNICQV